MHRKPCGYAQTNEGLREYKEDDMKKIEAIILPAKVGDVYAALEKVGCPDIMFSEIGDRGKQKGIDQQFRYHTPLLTKTKLEIVVNDEDVNNIVKAICGATSTGEAGDDKIFVLDFVECIRIHTEEQGGAAIG
jgi:nitrogen regulatory protein P-II 1